MKTLQKDRETVARLSQTLDKLARDKTLWAVPGSYNRDEKLPLTESGRNAVTQLVRFLCEHDIGPLSVMQSVQGTTVDVQVLTISSVELNNLFTTVRRWREKHRSRRKKVASLRFRIKISGNEDPSPEFRLRPS